MRLVTRSSSTLGALLAVVLCGCPAQDVCQDDDVTCYEGGAVAEEETGTLTGRTCRQADGSAAPGILVVIKDFATGEEVASTTSDATGSFSLRLPAADYDAFILETVGGTTVPHGGAIPISIYTGQTTELADPACSVAPPPSAGVVTGQICNPDLGVYVNNAAVSVTVGAQTYSDVTDTAGAFRIEGIPPGNHNLVVASAVFSRIYPVTVVAGQETLIDGSACTPTTGNIDGVACLGGGGPAVGALAYIDLPGVRVSDETDADGRFTLTGLPSGNHQLRIDVGGGSEQVQDVVVVPNQTAHVGPAACDAPPPPPPAPGTIVGHFCHPDGGALLGATVTVAVSSGVLETVTNDDGRFTLDDVEVGQRVVHIEHPDFTQDYPVNVPPGQTVTVDPVTECAPVAAPVGDIIGRICAPNGTTWLAGARVWVNLTSGGVIETVTDPDGFFTLPSVPVGTYKVHVAAGSFTTEIDGVVVTDGGSVTVGDSADECVPVVDPKVAVVSGEYDDIGAVLERLGVTDVTSFPGENGAYVAGLLTDYATLSQYDVVFFNCGLDDSFLANAANRVTAVENLRQYVQEGGSVYVSDWAYDLVEVAWPDYVDFHSYDGALDSAQMGDDMTITATVVDAELDLALGRNQVEIRFDLAQWAVIKDVAPETSIYLRGTVDVCQQVYNGQCLDFDEVPNTPITIGFHPGATAGKVIYTSFHQEQQTTADMDEILDLLVFEL